MTEEEALELLRARVKAVTQSYFAKIHHVSTQYLSDVVIGKVPIGKSVQKALGIRRVISYEFVERK